MEKGLLQNTGKTLEQWMEVVHHSKIEKHKEIIEYLKTEYGLTYGFANFIALKFKKSDAASFAEDDLITNQYQGKEILFPIYQQLSDQIKKLGKDITITPKKDSVSFIRKKTVCLDKTCLQN